MPLWGRLVTVDPTTRYFAKIYKTKFPQPCRKPAGIRPFLTAVENGENEKVLKFIEDGFDVDAESEQRQTPLLTAITAGNTTTCQLLIKNGCDVNKTGAVKPFFLCLSPLCQAVKEKKKEIVQMLIDAGCAKDQRDDFGRSAIFYSVTAGNSAILHLLLDAGCDVNTGSKDANYTLLHEACAKGNLEVVKILLEAGADPKIYEMNNQLTPAFYTIFIPIHKQLIQYGSNIRHCSRSGDTLLHHAIMHGNLRLVEFFLEMGAMINARQTACFISSNNFLQKVCFQDPLLLSAVEHHFSICRVLLQHGCPVSFLECADGDLAERLLNSDDEKLILTLLFASGSSAWLMKVLSKTNLSCIHLSAKTIAWLWKIASNVMPLKMLACFCVRKRLHEVSANRSIYPKARMLDIPQMTKDCIMLKNI